MTLQLFLTCVVFSQNTLTTDSVCLSNEEAKVVFKDLKKGQVCDSIMNVQQNYIENMKSILKGYKEETTILIDKNTEAERKLMWSNKKVKILGFTVKFGIPVGIAGGFILATVIKK